MPLTWGYNDNMSGDDSSAAKEYYLSKPKSVPVP
jgi:hypothetical protein